MRRDRFYAAVEAVVRGLAAIGSFCAFAIFVCMMVDIVWREVLRGSTEYAVDLSELLMVPLVFLILPYVAQIGANVRVELFIDSVSPRLRFIFELVSYLVFLPFAVLIGWVGWLATYDAYRFTSITESGIPKWPAMALIPFGSAFLCMQIIVLISRHISSKQTHSA